MENSKVQAQLIYWIKNRLNLNEQTWQQVPVESTPPIAVYSLMENLDAMRSFGRCFVDLWLKMHKAVRFGLKSFKAGFH